MFQKSKSCEKKFWVFCGRRDKGLKTVKKVSSDCPDSDVLFIASLPRGVYISLVLDEVVLEVGGGRRELMIVKSLSFVCFCQCHTELLGLADIHPVG